MISRNKTKMVQVVEIHSCRRRGHVILHYQYHGYWYPDDTRNQGIGSHMSIGLILPEHSNLKARRVQYLQGHPRPCVCDQKLKFMTWSTGGDMIKLLSDLKTLAIMSYRNWQRDWGQSGVTRDHDVQLSCAINQPLLAHHWRVHLCLLMTHFITPPMPRGVSTPGGKMSKQLLKDHNFLNNSPIFIIDSSTFNIFAFQKTLHTIHFNLKNCFGFGGRYLTP